MEHNGVAVYVHREASQWLNGLAAARIHRADALELYSLDRDLIAGLTARLERRMSAAVSVSDDRVFFSFADATVSGQVPIDHRARSLFTRA